jgi:hypothetical protein
MKQLFILQRSSLPARSVVPRLAPLCPQGARDTSVDASRVDHREVAIALYVLVLTVASLLAARPASATPAEHSPTAFFQALDRMMIALGPESARASATIRQAYRDHLNFLFLNGYADLEGALATGGVAPLPANPLDFNLLPRVSGPSPIGEMDLGNQHSYLAARPATIGCLLEVASRVRSAPLEITSLVRHGEYQEALKSTNRNATTSVPMHTMGLAFDIALINSSLETVYEIRDVLREMRDAGDLLFVGERRQLVFHVVPHPGRLGHFMDAYSAALGHPPAATAVQVVALDPRPSRGARGPRVVADIAAIRPADWTLAEAWSSGAALKAPVVAKATEPSAETAPLAVGSAQSAGVTARSGLALMAGLLAAVRRARSRRSQVAGFLRDGPGS